MRIGTWNLAGRHGDAHRSLIDQMRCDVLLLTEVSDRLDLSGWHVASTTEPMAPRRRWSAIASREPIAEVNQPHPASVAGVIDGVRFCSSILPWRGCTPRDFWVGEKLIDKQIHAASAIAAMRPQVWGGDWNQSFTGPETAGTIAGRRWLSEAIDRLHLQLPTADLPHRIEGISSIDHIAVPRAWSIVAAERVVAELEGRRLSDHDVYVVACQPSKSSP
ncbi:hypothetical protein GCM10022215_42640 [Nocardioides fonticola]|uniref:Endonuclease/exonuclease/phosphatase domain-containing protein n=1 Tax=Nocardioides fonticola TaxID=450363 RepID=A0ABP7Y2C9_9ACTN